MVGENSFAEAVRSRTGEFFDPAVRWQRALWNTGLTLSLKEILEAGDAVREGALHPAALKWLANSVHGMISGDPGSGSENERKALGVILTRDLSSGGVGYFELGHWTQTVEASYLSRWAKAVTAEQRPSREQTARALASHLLDLGFSSKWLRHWLRELEAETAAEIFEKADELVQRGKSTFELMLLFDKPPPARIAKPEEWRDAVAVSKWLRENGHKPDRQHGGLLLHIEAWDSGAAADQAADVVDRLLARVRVGTRESIEMRRHAHLGGDSGAALDGDPGVVLDLKRTRRAEVRALEREKRLLELKRTGPVDDALELLSHIIDAPAPVAVAGGWSAVESLLSGPGDETKGVTAERLGYLVACSWPRAELTTLAWLRQKDSVDDELSKGLASCSTNRERAQLLLDQIAMGNNLEFENPQDGMAARRIEKLATTPRQKLEAVQRSAETSLRRLYRQRNLVVHGGQVHGIALAAALRTASPLVGAGLDRITHAFLTRGISPLQLAAQAQMEVARTGSAGAPSLTSMLE
jgi:hypothetical protein